MKELSRNEIHSYFKKLEVALKDVLLGTSSGPSRSPSASEFMLMSITDENAVAFKHHFSRNYLFLLPNGELYVPVTNEAFNRGYFDSPCC